MYFCGPRRRLPILLLRAGAGIGGGRREDMFTTPRSQERARTGSLFGSIYNCRFRSLSSERPLECTAHPYDLCQWSIQTIGMFDPISCDIRLLLVQWFSACVFLQRLGMTPGTRRPLLLYSIQLALNYASETAKQVGLGESQCTICILMRDNVAYRLLYAVPRYNKALRGN